MDNHLDEIYEAYDELEIAKRKGDKKEIKRLEALIDDIRKDIVARATGKPRKNEK